MNTNLEKISKGVSGEAEFAQTSNIANSNKKDTKVHSRRKVNLQDQVIRDRVYRLARHQVSLTSIASCLSIKTATLNKYFKDEEDFKAVYEKGRLDGLAEIECAIIENATKYNNVRAQMFILERLSRDKWGCEQININSNFSINIDQSEKDLCLDN